MMFFVGVVESAPHMHFLVKLSAAMDHLYRESQLNGKCHCDSLCSLRRLGDYSFLKNPSISIGLGACDSPYIIRVTAHF